MYRLQRWYASNCDDDWERAYGVRIDTLDNPGWMLTIDLLGTRLEGMSVERRRVDRSETDWLQHEIVDDKFVACGGALNLEEMISIFLEIADR